MIIVVDYGMGNLRSVQNAFDYLGAESQVSSDPKVIGHADRLVLPGVGSFRRAMETIHAKGLADAVRTHALDRRKPLLAICLGMQLLADAGEEDGDTPGLGLVPGRVTRLTPTDPTLPIPHIGFNTVRFAATDGVMSASLGEEADFYFVHSYRMVCEDPRDVAGVCDYGGPFTAAVRRGAVWGTQFHPEKSQTNGLGLLRRFLEFEAPTC